MLQDKTKRYYIPPVAETYDVEGPLATDNIIICSNPADPNQGAEAKGSEESYDIFDFDDSQWFLILTAND